MDRAELWSQLMELTTDERIEPVQNLWDSVVSEALPPLTDEEKDELDRRLEEHRRDPSSAIGWDEVKAKLLSRQK